MKEIKEILIIILVVFICIFCLLFLFNELERYSCNKKATLMELRYNYSFFTGCMVKVDNKWQPFNEYNTVNIKN